MDRLPSPQSYMDTQGFDPVAMIYHVKTTYPPCADYLQGQVESQDPDRPGYITMPVLEADGGEVTDHAVGASELHFRIPTGYHVGDDGWVTMRFAFVSNNNSYHVSEWIERVEKM